MLSDSRIVTMFIYVSDLDVSRRFYEGTLGLRVLSSDERSVMFDCGSVVLGLNLASDYGIDLPVDRDNSTDVVWLVDDLRATQASLEARGVEFVAPVWYDVGGIVDFYDPDLHWLTLYEPSEKAMQWPSGERIAAVQAARNGRVPQTGELTLRDAELIYAFFFVPDAGETEEFWHHDLGLHDIEGGPCSQETENDEEGVIKYDSGMMMLTTHFYDQTRTPQEVEEHGCPPRILDMARMKGVAPAFHVPDLRGTVARLKERRPAFDPVVEDSPVGTIATCDDPSGHRFFLWQPSEAYLGTDVGRRVREILEVPL